MFEISKKDRDTLVNFMASIDGAITPKQAIAVINMLNSLKEIKPIAASEAPTTNPTEENQ